MSREWGILGGEKCYIGTYARQRSEALVETELR